MAQFIQAVSKYGPRIVAGKNVQLRELTERLADTTGQRPGEIMRVLMELERTLLYYNRLGRGVEIPGIGSLSNQLVS